MNNPKQKPGKKTSRTKRLPIYWIGLSVFGLVATIAAAVVWMSPPTLSPAEADVVVFKTATCSCCGKWVDHLRDHDLNVEVVHVRETQSAQRRLGVPATLGSCHTAQVGDYFVEGHVPADLVRRLLIEQPEGIRGIAVPGMPIGSPGMEGPNPVEYDVLSVDARGAIEVYETRLGQRTP